MSEWQVGDLAVCVDAGPIRIGNRFNARPDLIEGHVYRVIALDCAHPEWQNEPCLELEGVFFLASVQRFRKIRPDEQEACEPEFVTLLRKSKQRVSA